MLFMVGSNGIGKPRPKNNSQNYFCFAIALHVLFDSIYTILYSIVNIENELTFGGLKWNRTIDLTLIRRAL